MTLAARCPSCGTVFRVVQDQLRVSEGWVRCGRCSEVFNAIETLVDVESELEPQAAPPPRREAPPAPRPSEPPRRSPPPRPPPPPPPSPPRESAAPAAAADDLRAEPADRRESVASPDFVRRAERAERWKRPGVRAALAGVGLGAALLLAAQAAYTWRDLIAASSPAARTMLVASCSLLGCRIEPPHAIEMLQVESSGLVRVAGTSMYKLSVVLHNRSALALAPPALDLTLSDAQGAPIARRVLRLPEIGFAGKAVPAQGELPLQATITLGERVVSGYTIDLFYP